MKTIRLVRTQSNDPDFKYLTQLLDAFLNQKHDQQQTVYNPLNQIDSQASVLVASIDSIPVGCGCFKTHNTLTAEVKRMFVRDEFRGKGVARSLLCEIEKWSREMGYSRLVLETSIHLTNAIRLYESNGFYRIPNYPPYTDFRESICFEKKW